jgi:hypothetical protein
MIVELKIVKLKIVKLMIASLKIVHRRSSIAAPIILQWQRGD